ncbi:MAG: hypothetical protein Q7U33_03960 [Methylotenera sp.]|uniref:hypothetical protein n=1 Tax=Methylotenera sp. TaxID=2051956 RepID=UPI00272393E8|nr:hypothetical protein [Methylotenera sp.]MDO9150513.1 hypothetical protein [Methylotenera sp.]
MIFHREYLLFRTIAIALAFLILLIVVLNNKRLLCFCLLAISSIVIFNFTSPRTNSQLNNINSEIEIDSFYSDLKEIKFNQKPNVYIIGFLAASPSSVLKKTINISSSPFEEALKDNDFSIFKNTFSDAYPTRNAYASLFSLTDSVYKKIIPKERGYAFSGLKRSPLVTIFQSNGYAVTTVADDYKFGRPGGLHVDNYLVNKEFTLCKSDYYPEYVRNMMFFGACFIRNHEIFSNRKSESSSNFLISNIQNQSVNFKPQLLIAHLKPPIHAPSNITLDSNQNGVKAFRKHYLTAAQRAADNLIRIKEAILEKDQSAVILILGDSGVQISSKLYNQKNNDKLVIQDNFGVLAAVYPRDTCRVSYDKELSKGYITTVEIIRALVNCFSGQENTFPQSYMIRRANIQNSFLDFSNYLYDD